MFLNKAETEIEKPDNLTVVVDSSSGFINGKPIIAKLIQTGNFLQKLKVM